MPPRRVRHLGVLARVLSLALLAACSRESKPNTPEPADVGVPMPPPAAISRFAVPLEYDFTSVLKMVDGLVPRTFGSMDSVHQVPGDDRRHYAYQAERGPFTAFADGDRLHLRATFSYSARGYFKAGFAPTISVGCGGDDQRPRIVVELATPLTLTSSWHLSSSAKVVKVEPASDSERDRCDVSFLRKDVTPLVVDAARKALEGQLERIDGRIGEVDLKQHVTDWWAMLGKPIRLTDGVWLVIAPERLRLGPVGGHGKMLVVPVTLDARPSIVTEKTEPEVTQTPLPVLGRETAAADGYHIIMDAVVDYATASRQLSDAFAASSFSEAGHTVILDRVALVPLARGRLALTLTFHGDASGQLRLVGSPRIDHAHHEIVVPDLDFDIDTDSKLLETYAWLRSGGLRDELRRRARIPTSVALDKMRGLLLEGLNRKLGDAVTLAGTVDTVAVRGLFVTRDGLVVRAEAGGQAGMTVRQ